MCHRRVTRVPASSSQKKHASIWHHHTTLVYTSWICDLPLAGTHLSCVNKRSVVMLDANVASAANGANATNYGTNHVTNHNTHVQLLTFVDATSHSAAARSITQTT